MKISIHSGLGNQLFQYATARAISIDKNVDLFIDSWSGFIRDYKYQRKYSLKNFPIKAKLISASQRIPYLLFNLKKKLFKSNFYLHENFFNIQSINETKEKYLPQLRNIVIDKSTWINGYWQSPLYFQHHKSILQKELKLPKPSSQKYLKIGESMRSTQSVAIGVRLYEETENPLTLTINGKLKSIFEYNSAIKYIKNKIINPSFYLFCTHNSFFLDQLQLPKNTQRITSENGFSDEINTLWLLTQCKHHLFCS